MVGYKEMDNTMTIKIDATNDVDVVESRTLTYKMNLSCSTYI
jgi:hypothetical protein